MDLGYGQRGMSWAVSHTISIGPVLWRLVELQSHGGDFGLGKTNFVPE